MESPLPLFNSLGVDLGSSKTIYSKISLLNNNFKEKILKKVPSYITYSNNNVEVGENSKNLILQKIDSSYSNLSRIFPRMKAKIFESEKDFSINKKENLKPEKTLSDFLKKLNSILINEQMDSVTFSVPDFNTQVQKETLMRILLNIGMKKIAIINESSAITIYYGYKKYSELFIRENPVETPNNYIEKYVLFIDGGNSKISFIISKFTFLCFNVLNVVSLPTLGGRNFDLKLEEYVIDKFRKENKLKVFDYTNEMRFKLLEEIKNKREKLSSVEEVEIKVNKFYNNLDLKVKVNRNIFEKCISELIELYKESLKSLKEIPMRTGEKDEDGNNLFIKFSNLNVNKIEICGELINTPILKNITESILEIKVEKNLNPNDYIPYGNALMGLFFNKKFPKSYFENFFHFNYYRICYKYDSNLKESVTFINRGPIINWKRIIKLPEANDIKMIFEYAENELNIEGKIENREIMVYNIKCNDNQKQKFIRIFLRHDQKLVSECLIDEENKKLNGKISVEEFGGNIYWREIINRINGKNNELEKLILEIYDEVAKGNIDVQKYSSLFLKLKNYKNIHKKNSPEENQIFKNQIEKEWEQIKKECM